MDSSAHLQLGDATVSSADDPAADAQAQRDRSLDNDVENRLGALQASGALKADFVLRRASTSKKRSLAAP